MQDSNVALISRTQEFWRPHYGREITPEDARQIVANITGFFDVLRTFRTGELGDAADQSGDTGQCSAATSGTAGLSEGASR